eukprot:g2146.t1
MFSFFTHSDDKSKGTTSTKSKTASFSVVFCDPLKAIDEPVSKTGNEQESKSSKPLDHQRSGVVLRALRRFAPTRKVVRVDVEIEDDETLSALKLKALLAWATSVNASSQIRIVSDALALPPEEHEDFLASRGIPRHWLRIFDREGLEVFAAPSCPIGEVATHCRKTVAIKPLNFSHREFMMPFVPYIGFISNASGRLLYASPLENVVHTMLITGAPTRRHSVSNSNDSTEPDAICVRECASVDVGADLCAALLDFGHGVGSPGTALGEMDRRWRAENRLGGMIVALKRLLALIAAVREGRGEDGGGGHEATTIASSIDEDALIKAASVYLSTRVDCGFGDGSDSTQHRIATWFSTCVRWVDHVTPSTFGRAAEDGTERVFVDPRRGDDDASVGLCPLRPLRSLSRALSLLAAAKAVRNEGDCAIPEQIAALSSDAMARLASVPSESVFVSISGDRWVSHELLSRVRSVGASIMSYGLNSARLGPEQKIADRVSAALSTDDGKYFGATRDAANYLRRMLSVWILHRVEIEEFKKTSLSDDRLYDVRFSSASPFGKPFSDTNHLFRADKEVLKQAGSIVVADGSRDPTSLREIYLRAHSLDFTGHGLKSFVTDGVLTRMKHLQEIALAKNCLRFVKVRDMSDLRILDLSKNELGEHGAGASVFLWNLPMLTDLNLSHNRLRGGLFADTAEETAKGCLYVHGCDNLQSLDVSFNEFEWDEDIFRATIKRARVAFPNLQQLRLFGNFLEDISWEDQMLVLKDEGEFGKHLSIADTSDAYDVLDRAQGEIAEGLSRIHDTIMRSNMRVAMWRWKTRSKLSRIAATRFWWTVFRSQIRRARDVIARSCSEASRDVTLVMDAKTVRIAAETGRIAMKTLGEMLDVDLIVPPGEVSDSDGVAHTSVGPIVVHAHSTRSEALVRNRLIEIDGALIRINAEDVAGESIRLPTTTIQALRASCRRDHIQRGQRVHIVLGFRDCLGKILSASTTACASVHSYLPRLLRLVYTVSRHNRLNALRNAARRFVATSRRILNPTDATFVSSSQRELLLEDAPIARQRELLKVVDRVRKERYDVPCEIWPEAQRAMADRIARALRAVIEAGKSDGGSLDSIAPQAMKDNSISERHRGAVEDIRAFAIAFRGAQKQVGRQLGVSSDKRSSSERERADALIRSTHSEASRRVRVVTESCNPRYVLSGKQLSANTKTDTRGLVTAFEVTRKHFEDAAASDKCHLILARFAERVHRGWKLTALRRWNRFARCESLAATRQEARWLDVLTRQSEFRYNALHMQVKDAMSEAMEVIEEKHAKIATGPTDWKEYVGADGKPYWHSDSADLTAYDKDPRVV